jgi:hypothetical protein
MNEDLGALLHGVEQIDPNQISYVIDPYITWASLLVIATQGTITFFLVRFAHNAVYDPNFERKWFKKKHKKKHTKR